MTGSPVENSVATGSPWTPVPFVATTGRWLVVSTLRRNPRQTRPPSPEVPKPSGVGEGRDPCTRPVSTPRLVSCGPVSSLQRPDPGSRSLRLSFVLPRLLLRGPSGASDGSMISVFQSADVSTSTRKDGTEVDPRSGPTPVKVDTVVETVGGLPGKGRLQFHTEPVIRSRTPGTVPVD